jgi:hypothetical protein
MEKSTSSGAHKRRSARKRVKQVMMVTNSFTGESMGRIGNLSKEGMMLIATRELPDEHVYQITFGLAQSPRLRSVSKRCGASRPALGKPTGWAAK